MLASNFAGLYVLAALACPIGMGLMMVFMGRGMMGGKTRQQATPTSGNEDESLDALKTEQARLAAKIAALEDRERTPVRDGEPEPDESSVERTERAPV